MSLNVGELYATLGLDTKPFEAGIGKADSGMSRLASSASNVVGKIASGLKTAAKVGALATAGMGASLAYVGTGYNNMEQSARAAFKTILGSSDAADEMMGKIAEFGKSSPFPRQAFIAGTQQLLGFGVAAENVIPTLDAIQDAVAATGGGAPEIESITYALAQVQGSGKLTGETLSQLGQYGIDAASIIGKSMGKTSDEIRDLAAKPGGIPADKVFMPLVDGLTEKFGGAAANVKETWAGAIDRIKGAWRDMGSDLMEPFISKGGGGMGVELANTFASSLRAVQASIMPEITRTLASVTSAVMPQLNAVMMQIPGTLAPVLASILPAVQPVVEAIGGALLTAFEALAPVLPQIAEVVAQVAIAFSQGLSQAIVTLAPVVAQIAFAFTSGLGAALDSLLPVLAGVATAMTGALLDVLTAITPAIPPIIQFVGQLAATLASGLASAINAVAPVLSQIAWILGGVLTAALESITPLLPLLSTLFAQVAATVGGALAKAFKAMVPVIPKLVDALAQVAGVIGDALLEVLDALTPILPGLAKAFGQIAGVVADVFLTALNALKPMLPIIASAFVSLLQAVSDLWAAAGPALLDLAEMLGAALVDAITAIVPMLPGLVDAFNELVGVLVEALVPILPALVEALAQILPALIPIIPPLTSLATKLVELLAAVPPGAIQAIAAGFAAFKIGKGAVDGISKVTESLTGLKNHISKISAAPISKIKSGFDSLRLGAMYAKDGIAKFAVGMRTAASSAAQFAAQGLTTAANWAKATAASISKIKAAQLAQAAASKVATAAQWLWNAAMNANPIGLIVAGIAALVAGLVLAYTKVGWFRDFVDAAFDAVKAAAQAVVSFFTSAWSTITGLLAGPFRLGQQVISAVFDLVKAAVFGAIEYVKLQILIIKTTFELVRDAVSTAISAVVGFVTGIPGRIRSGVDSILGIFKGPFSSAKTWIRDRIDDIVGFVKKIPDRIGKVLKGVGDIISAPFKAAGDAIRTLWNSTVGGFGVKIPDIPGLPGRGKEFKIPKIPEAHTGTIVPGGPSNEPLYRLQGGERVLSIAQNQAFERLLNGVSGIVSRTGTRLRNTTPAPSSLASATPLTATRQTAPAGRGPVTGVHIDNATFASTLDVDTVMRQSEFAISRLVA